MRTTHTSRRNYGCRMLKALWVHCNPGRLPVAGHSGGGPAQPSKPAKRRSRAELRSLHWLKGSKMGRIKRAGGAYAAQEIRDIDEMLTYAAKFGLAAEVVWSASTVCMGYLFKKQRLTRARRVGTDVWIARTAGRADRPRPAATAISSPFP